MNTPSFWGTTKLPKQITKIDNIFSLSDKRKPERGKERSQNEAEWQLWSDSLSQKKVPLPSTLEKMDEKKKERKIKEASQQYLSKDFILDLVGIPNWLAFRVNLFGSAHNNDLQIG